MYPFHSTLYRTLLAVILISPTLAQKWERDTSFKPVIHRNSSIDEYVAIEAFANGYFAYTPYSLPQISQVNHLDTSPLIRIDATGAFDETFQSALPTDSSIRDVAPLADGSCWVLFHRLADPVPFGPTNQTTGIVAVGHPVEPPPPAILLKLRSDGAREPNVPEQLLPANSEITALSDGGLLVHGSFDEILGQPRRLLACLTPDGQLDPEFVPALNSTHSIRALAVGPNDRIYIAGWVNSNIPSTVESSTPFTAKILRSGKFDPAFNSSEFIDNLTGMVATTSGFAMFSGNVVHRFDAFGALTLSTRIFPLNSFLSPPPSLTGWINGLSATADDGLIVSTRHKLHEEHEPEVYYDSIVSLSPDGSTITDWQLDFAEPTNIRLAANHLHGNPLVTISPSSSEYPDSFLREYFPDSQRHSWALYQSHQRTDLSLIFTHQTPGQINQMWEDAAGRVLVSGNFTAINQTPRNRIARFHPDGQLDPTYNPPVSDILLPLSGGGAIVRQWELIDRNSNDQSVLAARFHRLSPDGSIDTSFTLAEPHAGPNTNWLLEDAAGNLLVSSYVEREENAQVSSLVWLNSSGAEISRLPPLFTSELISIGITNIIPPQWPYFHRIPNPITWATMTSSDELIVGGGFVRVSGKNRPGLARLTREGALDLSYAPEIAHLSNSLILPDGSALISEYRNSQVPPRLLRKLRPNGSVDNTFSHPFSDSISTLIGTEKFLGAAGLYNLDGQTDLGFNRSDIGQTGYLVDGLLDLSSRLWISTNPGYQGQPFFGRFTAKSANGIAGESKSISTTEGEPASFHFKPGSPDPHTIRWFHNSVIIEGQTTSRLVFDRTKISDVGTYYAEISYGADTFTTTPRTLAVETNTARLVNLSARSYVTAGHPQVLGFRPAVDENRPFLIRALGWGLASVDQSLAQTGLLPEPILRLHDSQGTVIDRDIGSALSEPIQQLSAQLGAFPIRPFGPFIPGLNYGSAMTNSLSNVPHTASVTSLPNEQGLSLLELYDASDDGLRGLSNLSVRALAQSGAKTLTAGFVIQGKGPARILIRAVGPSLAEFKINDAAPDPTVRLFKRNQEIASNADWQGSPEIIAAAKTAGAFAINPDSLDAAILVNLVPGVYTAQVEVSDAGSGQALLEVYHLDP